MKDDPELGAFESGLVEVMVKDTDNLAGMAFLVAPRLAITCGHVVNIALGRDNILDNSQPPGTARVKLRFPFAHDLPPGSNPPVPERGAEILKFHPPGRRPVDDIALLGLEADAPGEVGLAVLADIRNVGLADDPLGVFGPSAGSQLIVHFDARFGGSINPSWTQLDPVQSGGNFVVPGFSGGRVWNFAHEAATGMIVSTQTGTTQKRAFMIPASAIRRFLPALPSEKRVVSAGFCAIWTVYATVTLLLMLTHFLGERIGSYPAVLSLGTGNPVVSGFFGMHIGAVLLPIAFWMLIRFASGYSEHPWWMRLPQFGRFDRIARSTSTWWTAALSLFLFVAIPLYIQGHFLNMFPTGKVYIYPSNFGYTTDCLEKTGSKCFHHTMEYCEFKEAGLMSVVTPINGARGGYLDNAYHYGNREIRPPNSVTFFPILQPVVLYGLSLISLLLALRLAYLVFRPAIWKRIQSRAFDPP